MESTRGCVGSRGRRRRSAVPYRTGQRRSRRRLLVGFSLSQGDEIQALAGSLVDAWRIVDAFDSLGDEPRFRFTLGVGEVASAFADRTWDMDGTCFHHARDAMASAKQERRWVAVLGLGETDDRIVNGMIRSLQVVREDWTTRQREAVLVRRETTRQREAAVRLGINQATLSKMLKAAHYGAYMETDDALRRLLQRLWHTTWPARSRAG